MDPVAPVRQIVGTDKGGVGDLIGQVAVGDPPAAQGIRPTVIWGSARAISMPVNNASRERMTMKAARNGVFVAMVRLLMKESCVSSSLLSRA